MRTVPAVTSVRSTWMSPLPSTVNVIRRGIASGAIRSSMPSRLKVASRAIASPSSAEVAVGLGAPIDGVLIDEDVGTGELADGRTVGELETDIDGELEPAATDDGAGEGEAD